MAVMILQQRALVARCVAPMKVSAPMKLSAPKSIRSSRLVARATDPSKPPAQGDNILGMPTDSGFVGFVPFAETWTGRWAMLGVVSSIVVEFVTGKPTLQQIGLVTPSYPLLVVLVAVFATATAVASGTTAQALLNKKMGIADMSRYRSFLGLDKENESDLMASGMKAKVVQPGATVSADAAAAAAAAASPAAAEGVEPLKQQDPRVLSAGQWEVDNAGTAEQRFARDVEIVNGRWAMMGFLSAVLIEAGTGNGIIGQCIGYAKAVGLLGPMSGF